MDKDPTSCGSCLARIVTAQLNAEPINWADFGSEKALCIACKDALQEGFGLQKIEIEESIQGEQ